MPTIEWKDSFGVNNSEIDSQHKRWIEIINNLHEMIMSNDSGELRDATNDALKAMYEYSKAHFSFEEKYLEELGYPERQAHHRLHKDFDNEIYGYLREVENGGIVLNTTIISRLKNWLVGHILIEDKKYSAFVASITKV